MAARRSRQCVLYHATSTRMKPGARLVARRSRETAVIEPFFEAVRPDTAPSRSKAFYLGERSEREHLSGDLGASSNRYVYSVEPQGSIVRTDPGWVGEAVGAYEVQHGSRGQSQVTDRSARRLSTIARNYWAGVRAPNHQGWEWLASVIVICELVAQAPKDKDLLYYLTPAGSVLAFETVEQRRSAIQKPWARGGIDITYRQAKDILALRLDPRKLFSQ